MSASTHVPFNEVDPDAIRRLDRLGDVLLKSIMEALTEVVPTLYHSRGSAWRMTRDVMHQLFRQQLGWAADGTVPDRDELRIIVEPGRRKGRHRIPRAQLFSSIGALEKAMFQVLWGSTDLRDISTVRAVTESLRAQGSDLTGLLLDGYELGLGEHGHVAELKTALCRSWLDGRVDTISADILGFSSEPYAVVVLTPVALDHSEVLSALHRFLTATQDVVGTIHADYLVLVLPTRDGDPFSVAQNLLDRLRKHEPAIAYGTCAVGEAPDRAGVALACVDAIAAHDLAAAARDPRTVVGTDDVVLERILHRSAERSALTRVLDELGPDLLTTLDVFYANDMDKQLAARALHVHRNTLDYRLRQIHRTTGLNPTSVRGVQLLSSAFTLRRMSGQRGTGQQAR